MLSQVEELAGWWICHKKCGCESHSGQLTTIRVNDHFLKHSQVEFYTINAGSLKGKLTKLKNCFSSLLGQSIAKQKGWYDILAHDR